MKLKDKIIIHNYTNLSDYKVLNYMYQVIGNGKISETDNEENQYALATRFKSGYAVTCDRKGNTYTFKIVEDNI